MTTRTVPTGTTSPSATRIRATLPAAGDGISTVVLSVCTSTSGSSSATSWPSVTSQRATSPSVRPSPRSGSLNSYAIRPWSLREPHRVVAQHRVRSPHAVDDLRDPQVDDHARQRERLPAPDPVLARQQREHPLERLRGGLVEVLVEAERDPGALHASLRVRELRALAQPDRHLAPLDRALHGERRNLAVALQAVRVAQREEGAVDRDRQEQGRAGDEQRAVDVPAPATR